MDNHWIVKLCSRRWCLKALALIASGCPAKVSPLASRAGCGRTAMGASVEHLIRLKLLQRNPGHGHPLRPEYRLTAAGVALADWALALEQFAANKRERDLLKSKWSLAVLGSLNPVQRYSYLRKTLSPVTDRALTNCLVRLSDVRWVERDVCVDSAPPAVNYVASGKGLIIHEHVHKLGALNINRPGF